ncbi:hypothetical protein TNCV_193331 [Trichonephila clavipes]|nr:hypothetical protein TNCV_193331 [Trichonephila clavipes]
MLSDPLGNLYDPRDLHFNQPEEEVFQGIGTFFVSQGLEINLHEESGWDKSGDPVGQFRAPRREISHLGRVAPESPLEVWAATPSCCNNTLSRPLSWRAEIFLVARKAPIHIKKYFRSGTRPREGISK